MFRQASSEWINDNAQRLGASVAFYTLLSLAPVIVIAVAVAAVVYGQEAAQGRLASEIRGVAGPDVARTIQEIIRGAYKPGTGVIATVLGLVTLAFGASSIFVELHDAMNTIWHVPLPRDRTNAATVIRLIRDRFYSFATVLGTGFLLLVSLVLNAWIAAMGIAVPRAATFMMSVLVIAVLFAALYKIVPDVQIEVERRGSRSHNHRIAFYDWEAAHGAVLREHQLRVDVSCCRLAACSVAMGILLGADILLGR